MTQITQIKKRAVLSSPKPPAFAKASASAKATAHKTASRPASRLFVILFTLLLATAVSGQPAVTASAAWLSEAASDGTAAAYLSVSNPTMYDIYLVSVTTAAAEKVEFREGEATVKEITVPSFGSIDLKPGGTWLRLSDLKRPLKVGETIEIVLTTDAGIVLKVPAPVRGS